MFDMIIQKMIDMIMSNFDQIDTRFDLSSMQYVKLVRYIHFMNDILIIINLFFVIVLEIWDDQ